MSWETPQTLSSPTGAELALRSTLPKGKPHAIVHINHGMAEHAARYRRFAEFLAGRGYAVLAHDHRGHGATTAPDAPFGSFGGRGGFAKVIEDVHAVNRHIRENHAGVPIVVFGHSMGAIIAFNYVLDRHESVAGAAIWNVSFNTGALFSIGRLLLTAERAFKGSDVPSTLADKLTFQAWNKQYTPNRTDFDWLSRDHAEVDKYIEDPLCGFTVSNGMWLAVLDAISAAADDGRLADLPCTLPFNLVAGGHDPVSEKGEAILALGRCLQQAGFSDVATTIYPESRHECLNDLDRDKVMAEFAGWLDERFG